MEKFILSLDQGTTSSRAILFNKNGEIQQVSQKEFTQFYPQPGWVEHDAEEIWATQWEVTQTVLKNGNILPEQIEAIGITNQRETTVIWDKHTGKPVANAIVWQDRRTAAYCDELKERDNLQSYIRENTGLVIVSPVGLSITLKVLTTPIPQASKTLILYTPTGKFEKVLEVCAGNNTGPKNIS